MKSVKKYLLPVFIAIFVHTELFSQRVESLNDNWEFVALYQTSVGGEIKNQGINWSDQFDVKHTDSSQVLALSEQLIEQERKMLETAEWEIVSVPHTPFIEELTVLHQWQGVSYYRREILLDSSLRGKQIWIEFEAAMTLSDIWVNGVHVTQHAGGYLPFVVDITDIASYDSPNQIVVRLDNGEQPLIPPGKPLNSLDFCYYGGIYRDVNLIIKHKNHISHPIAANKVAGGGVFVTYPQVNRDSANVKIKTHIVQSEPNNGQLRYRLYPLKGLFGNYKRGGVVAESVVVLSDVLEQEVEDELIVVEPNLWSPNTPYLYLLVVELIEDGKVVDSQQERIGIRHIEMSKEGGFVINGEPLRLVGSNRHMEYPYLGNAISDAAHYRDIYQIKESGFNTVRLGHYPQDKSVLDACDELGVLVIEPMPGWQYFNADTLFVNLTYRDIRDMIRRDRNHPSIIMWETILNESWPPNDWKDGAIAIAHEEYPGNQCFASGDSYGYDGYDVCYNDWSEGFNRANNTSKPSFIREYYDYEFGGHYSTTRKSRGDGEQALLGSSWNAQWSHNRYRSQYPWTMGDAVWSMYDYNRGCCDNICRSGVADIFRLPKFSLNFFKSQQNIGDLLPSGYQHPYLFIANYWTERPAEDNKVVVYGNVDQVELKVNGVSVARQFKDSGATTDYSADSNGWYTGGDSFDGGNCENLSQSPFTFSNIEWSSGYIEAVGYVDGKRVVKSSVSTPLEAKELSISYFESGCKAQKEDVLIIYVSLIDKNGTLNVLDNETKIELTVLSGGRVVGAESMSLEAGIASFIVQTNDASKLKLLATGGGFKSIKSMKLESK